MVVAELDVVRIAVEKAEADAPLIIDRNSVLPDAVSLERMESIAGSEQFLGLPIRAGLEHPRM